MADASFSERDIHLWTLKAMVHLLLVNSAKHAGPGFLEALHRQGQRFVEQANVPRDAKSLLHANLKEALAMIEADVQRPSSQQTN